MQTTLGGVVTLSGTGVHTGRPARVTLKPADADSGIRFRRVDLSNGTRSTVVKVEHCNVKTMQLCTVIGNADGVTVMTVEHILAALAGMGVDNVYVHINGPEVPILDGSARDYVEAIDRVGLVTQSVPRSFIRILHPVRLQIGESIAEFQPHHRQVISTDIEFTHRDIGNQSITFEVGGETFREQIAGARTFGFLAQAEQLRAAGYGLGASLENTIVLGDDGVINDNGLRFTDEFVRHKALDACGDLALAGAPILGRFWSHRGGHQLNHAALNCLMSQERAWEWVGGDNLQTDTIAFDKTPAEVPEFAYAT
ncbi:UDP-3-O-[3-hydroxymyristoyl] N-acetylglucosamine deacetylase [hydrothermal vent metagenome]|uniref:UDP-3-O-acyl-N-acetylglucosamine deacetylase n=1 Tax=hydrothermal vent metagenome TaxID=652676 RepID=A0A3B0THK0_9ZZZZ